MATPRYDVLFRDVSVVDGTGKPRFRSDVAVTGDRIVAVGKALEGGAYHEIDGAGRVLAPGFIDSHTHDDSLILDSYAEPKLTQGVTTVVTGNCGISLAPLAWESGSMLPPPLDLLGTADTFRYPTFKGYIDAISRFVPAVNVVPLVGHGTLRVNTMGSDFGRPATPSEIGRMEDMLDAAMDAGAAGFSTGLVYPPNREAPTSEIVALARVAARHGGVYATHLRNEGDQIIAALDEAFIIGESAGASVVLSHHKCMGHANFGRSAETLGHIANARRKIPVVQDAYPYTAGSSMLMKDFVAASERVTVSWSDSRPEFAGVDLAEVASHLKCTPEQAIEHLQPGGGIYYSMCEEDVQRILLDRYTMIGSDGLPRDKHPHPRLWGTFAKVLGHYVRDIALLNLEEAVRRMTSLPAETFGLQDRGLVAPGQFADLVLFCEESIADRATYERPRERAAGIDYVMVNGSLAVSPDGIAPSKNGRVLKSNRRKE